jgi:hypothetical protein
MDPRSQPSLDLEAILRMFPSRSPIAGQINQPERFDQGFAFGNYGPEDLLYGFMNGEAGAFADFY